MSAAASSPDFAALAQLADRVRGHCVAMSHRAGAPHLGSALSCVDLLTALYGTALRLDGIRAGRVDRDRLIFSKGHAASALYAVLAEFGFCPVAELATYAQPGSRLPEHPAAGCLPALEAATGSLGHGLPLGLGLALAARLRGDDSRVYVLMSDGECNEGSVWEAALVAPAQQLGQVTVLIDFNRWQATGRSTEVTSLEPLAEKWHAFGWRTAEVDGHDLVALAEALRPTASDRPLAVVCHTVKGRGVSFMEDDNNWHYRVPSAAELAAAFAELGLEAPAL